MQEQIFDMLLKEEEISWRTILYDLIKTEQMDPWGINISLLTHKYLEVIKEMKEHNLRISGKMLLAAAFLLKLKSTHLVDNDITRFDALLHAEEEEIYEEDFLEELGGRNRYDREKMPLIPKNPQPRSRKVSIHDLVDALQRAMASKKRGLTRIKPVKYNLPERKIDIMEVIRDVYHKVVYYSKKDGSKKLSFNRLLPPRPSKEDKVYTFLPLLHLENQHKLEIVQASPFKEIFVSLTKKGKK